MSRKLRIQAKQQLENKRRANQQNAAHSTGPVTEEGKSASSRNSFRHGLTGSAITALAGEDIQDYMDLGNSMRAEYQPVTITEDALVSKMIQSLWLSRRATNHQQSLMLLPKYRIAEFNLYMRYQTMHDRMFFRSLTELQKLKEEARKLKEEARKQQVGFVSQKRTEQLHEAKVRNLNARSEAIAATANRAQSRISAPRTSETPRNAPDLQSGSL